MTLFFITFDKLDNFGHQVIDQDLCQAATADQAIQKEMGKQAAHKVDTSNYKVYNLSTLLNHYGIKIVKDESKISYKPVANLNNPKTIEKEVENKMKKSEVHPDAEAIKQNLLKLGDEAIKTS